MVKTVTHTSMQLQETFTKKKAKTGSKSVILEDHKVLKGIKVKMESKDLKGQKETKETKVFKVVMDVKGYKVYQDEMDEMDLKDQQDVTDVTEKMY